MHTFRNEGNQSIHSHRLLYLHSSEADRKTTSSTKRFKTDPQQQISFECMRPSLQQVSQSTKAKEKNAQSVRQIQYFNLDLKNISSGSSVNDSKILKQSSRSQYDNSSKQKLLQCTKDSQSLVSSARSDCSAKCLIGRVKYLGKSSQKLKLQTILDKQNLQQLWKPIGLPQNNRLQKMKEAPRHKYYNLKTNNHKPLSKTILSTKAKQAQKVGPRTKIRQKSFEVKRIEKILVDEEGFNYRMTIQKM